MLDYTCFGNCHGLSIEDREEGMKTYILDTIEKRLQYFSDKEEEVKKATYELGLIELDIVNLVKEDIARNFNLNFFAGFVFSSLLDKAWSYNRINKDEKTDPKTKEDYKQSLDFVLSQLQHRFWEDDPDFEFTELVRRGYEGYAYEAHYNYKGLKIYILMYDYSQANIGNYYEMLDGYRIEYEEKPHFWNIAVRGLGWKDLHKQFVSWYDVNDLEHKDEEEK